MNVKARHIDLVVGDYLRLRHGAAMEAARGLNPVGQHDANAIMEAFAGTVSRLLGEDGAVALGDPGDGLVVIVVSGRALYLVSLIEEDGANAPLPSKVDVVRLVDLEGATIHHVVRLGVEGDPEKIERIDLRHDRLSVKFTSEHFDSGTAEELLQALHSLA